MEENIKLYSNREITIATFFGGPLAAGYLVKKNYQVMGESDKGVMSLVIGIISTTILLAGLLLVPESITDRIHGPLLPIIYTAIISILVNKFQGSFIKAHKENGGSFYSGWKAAGVGAVCMLILMASVALVAFIAGDFSTKSDFDAVGYDKEVAKFTLNENKAMTVYKVLETANPEYLKEEFEKGLILWIANRRIIISLNSYSNLPKELQVQNQKLLKYCDLRIQQCRIIIKTITENTDKYGSQLNKVGTNIDEIIEQLQTPKK